MRKTLVSVAIALSIIMTLNAINPNVLVPIPLTVQIVKKGGAVNPFPKSPALPPEAPEASIDGHTLYLYDVDYDLTLCLLDEDGEEVYTVFIPANTASVVLPATLTGDYELQLYTDGIYDFAGWVEL